LENLQGYGAQTAREGRRQSPYDGASGGDDLDRKKGNEKHKKIKEKSSTTEARNEPPTKE